MGVYIKGSKMPKSCSECELDLRTDICKAFCEWNAEHPYSIRGKDRLPDCPLVEVPEPHGRLIDADALDSRMYHEAFEKDSEYQKWDSGCWIRYKLFERVLREQPTIEPEREKGEWVDDTNDGNFVTCSKCMVYSWRKDFVKTRGFNFCPNCGADLRGEPDD